MTKQAIVRAAAAIPRTAMTVGVALALVLVLIAAIAPLSAVWVLALYLAALVVAAIGVTVAQRKNTP